MEGKSSQKTAILILSLELNNGTPRKKIIITKAIKKKAIHYLRLVEEVEAKSP